jgi:hypothetical protein
MTHIVADCHTNVREDTMKNIKRFGFVLTIIGVVLGVIGFVPANAATGDGDFHFTVVSAAYDYDQADLTITNETRATINGATQLTWWFPNHNIKVSMKSVRKAPHIKSRYVPCSRQSKWIAKKAHGAPVVVLKPGSEACNTGKLGHIDGGFKWTVKVPAVLKWNKSLKLYQHIYNIIGGKLVKTCGNHIGGHVDVMFNNVVQVRYEQDVVMNGKAKAKTKVYTDVEFGVTCPNGAYFKVKAGASAYGYAEADVTFTSRTRATVLEGKRVKLTSDSHGDGQVSALSAAQTSIDVSGNCGSTPPPSPTGTVSIDQMNDLDQSTIDPNTGDVIESWTTTDADYSTAAGQTAQLVLDCNTCGRVVFPNGQSTMSITGDGSQHTVVVEYVAGTEPGTDTVTFEMRINGQPVDSASTNITINPTPTPPL